VNGVLVKKRINNNVVLACAEEDQTDELILIGKGIGFQVYPDDVIDTNKIQQTFLPSENLSVSKMAAVLTDSSLEDVQLVEAIVRLGEEQLGKKLPSGIIFSLLDHLNLAFQRYKEAITIKSPLEWEVKQFYRTEIEIGKKALVLIQQEKQMLLPDSEAVFIALHFINYEYEHQSMAATMEYMEIMKDISKMIQYQFQVDLDEQSVDYQRFLNHLRYYVIRIKEQKKTANSSNQEIVTMVQKKYPKAFKMSVIISQYLEDRYHTKANIDENLYLTLHLTRLLQIE
jgi:beta-glucoside operon transcriptional antiterminator